MTQALPLRGRFGRDPAVLSVRRAAAAAAALAAAVVLMPDQGRATSYDATGSGCNAARVGSATDCLGVFKGDHGVGGVGGFFGFSDWTLGGLTLSNGHGGAIDFSGTFGFGVTVPEGASATYMLVLEVLKPETDYSAQIEDAEAEVSIKQTAFSSAKDAFRPIQAEYNRDAGRLWHIETALRDVDSSPRGIDAGFIQQFFVREIDRLMFSGQIDEAFRIGGELDSINGGSRGDDDREVFFNGYVDMIRTERSDILEQRDLLKPSYDTAEQELNDAQVALNTALTELGTLQATAANVPNLPIFAAYQLDPTADCLLGNSCTWNTADLGNRALSKSSGYYGIIPAPDDRAIGAIPLPMGASLIVGAFCLAGAARRVTRRPAA